MSYEHGVARFTSMIAAWMRSEELDRPENKGLKDIMGKLKKAKAAIDAGGAGAALLLSPAGDDMPV